MMNTPTKLYRIRAHCKLPRALTSLRFQRALNRLSVGHLSAEHLGTYCGLSNSEVTLLLDVLAEAGVLEITRAGQPASQRADLLARLRRRLSEAAIAAAALQWASRRRRQAGRCWDWLKRTRQDEFEAAEESLHAMSSIWQTTLSIRLPSTAVRRTDHGKWQG